MKNVISLCMIILSPVMVISSSNWMMIWIFLEMGSIGFIQLVKSKKNSESSILYFLIQAIASSLILASMLVKNMDSLNSSFSSSKSDLIIILAIITKIGACPLHHWYLKTAKSFKSNELITLMTIQKAAPLLIIQSVKSFPPLAVSALISAFLGVLSQLSASKTKTLIIFSSLNHTGWMMILVSLSFNSFMIYMIIYFVLNFMILKSMEKENLSFVSTQESNKVKKTFIILLLSLSGIPPLMGFIPKWIAISTFLKEWNNYMLTFILLSLSVANAFIYCRLLINSSTASPTSSKMLAKESMKKEKSIALNVSPTPLMVLMSK